MKRLLRFGFSCVCLVLAIAEDAIAQYVTSGPYGGAVHSFYEDNGIFYAAGTGGVYKSTNNGRTWQELGTVPSTFGCDAIHSVAVSGSNIYAGSLQTGIYRSQDGGNTWLPSTAGLRIALGAPYADIEVSGPNVLAVRPDSGFLYFSANQGTSWVLINPAIGGAFAQHLSAHNGNVYVTTPSGLFVSINNGMSFVNINSNPADYGKLSWKGDTAYVATAAGIRMSLDGGMSFSDAALTGIPVRDVAARDTFMYAVIRNPAPLQDSVLYSSNEGANFYTAPFMPSGFSFNFVHNLTATSAGLLVGSDYGLYSTVSYGANWGLADSGYRAAGVNGLAVAGDYVLGGTSPMGVFRVKPGSGALNWKHTGTITQGVGQHILAVAAKGAIAHAGGPIGYYRSTDSGATWSVGTTGISGGNVTSIYVDDVPNSREVWMIRNGNLYQSLDDGASFGLVVNSTIPGGTARHVWKADTAIFVTAQNTLYKGGKAAVFAPVAGIGPQVTGVVFVGNTFYASTAGSGIFSSSNGANWTPVSISPTPPRINALASLGSDLVAGTDNGFYSNAGGSWVHGGLPDRIVRSLAVRAGKLFVGTCNGVYSIPYNAEFPNAVQTLQGQQAALSIWPNPARGAFALTMQVQKDLNAELQIRDITGALVLRRSTALKSGRNDIRIALEQRDFAPGLYTVQLIGEALRATGKVVIY